MGSHFVRSEDAQRVVNVAGWTIQERYFEMNGKKRIQEPSTWAGLGGILAAMASLPIPVAQPWLAGLAGVAGAIAMWLREGQN